MLVINKPRKKSGRPAWDALPIFSGLIWLARTGRQWRQLARWYGPQSTVHERFCAWVEHDCFRTAWAMVPEEYDQELGTLWEWQTADGSMLKAPLGKGAGAPEATGRQPTDRGRAGCKRTLLTDAKGIPLSVVLCGANQHDSTVLSGAPDAVVVAAPVEQEQRRLLLDRGYDTPACRQLAMDQGLVAHIPKTSAAAQPIPAPGDPQRHPPRRSVVEVGHSWFNRFRRLQTRWEKRQDLHPGFVELAACLIIWRKLVPVARLKTSSGWALKRVSLYCPLRLGKMIGMNTEGGDRYKHYDGSAAYRADELFLPQE
ncbi:Transposase DDE domain-containing protein [Deinococcus hopiensis KR-140]|uniref:Transposase DDE domain-containing protein n=1 Tax=Deinococcus hopiensis KR-140 TaxID=695939 RepID=A0A1W1ULH9_9DEIO|nr:Transposase DDE domain-containing protein [Deinococcus hopiensis KR-140]